MSPKRIGVIQELILPADIIADVGCDHALVAEYAVKRGLSRRVIASDISDRCLDKARKLLGGEDNVEFIRCDGIAYECDEAIIAGMGGITVSGIINNAVKLPKTLIVCPHRDVPLVRKTLIASGYGIDVDVTIEEKKKFYTVIRARLGEGETELSELQMLFGLNIAKKSECMARYLSVQRAVCMLAPEENAERLKAIDNALKLQGA